MKETTKTSILLASAVLFAILAVLTRPVAVEMTSHDRVGKPLFEKFKNALDIKGLKIIRPSTLEGNREFRLIEANDFWTIPSHDGYPADAKDRMPKIAEALIDLTVLEVADAMTDAKDPVSVHARYGVLDPGAESSGPEEGIGIRIAVTGAADETLVDMIVGKEVEGEQGPDGKRLETGLRYVRIAGEQPIYVVRLDADIFSIKFGDWIEKNLLDIGTLDMKELFIDEYATEVTESLVGGRVSLGIVPDFSGDMTLSYNGSETGAAKWALTKLMGFRGRDHQYYEQQMKPDEELNVETLDAMVGALNDLKIVDVKRKPEKLAANLRDGTPLEAIGADLAMIGLGFSIVQMKDPKDGAMKTKVLSRNGDFRITMKDGIRYTLRFGNSAGLGTGDDTKVSQAGTGDDGPKETNVSEGVGLNRYLFITAEFDESTLTKPEPIPSITLPTEGEEAIDAAKKENEEIEKRNQRQSDQYVAKLEEGRKRAKALTARFAPWYYVISEDVYKKIHLTRATVFKKREQPADETGTANPTAPQVPPLPSLPDMETLLEEKPPAQAEPKPTEAEPVKESAPATAPKEPVKEEPKPEVKEEKVSPKETTKPTEEPKQAEPVSQEKPNENPAE